VVSERIRAAPITSTAATSTMPTPANTGPCGSRRREPVVGPFGGVSGGTG
jgi:hypothetical protein